MNDKNIPSVAIILVNYNGYKDTAECVESLSRIDYTNRKIIIVDNGSTDKSLDKLRLLENEEIVIINANDNLGFSGGNNVGIQYAIDNGFRYVLLLNNDTVVKQEFLSELVRTSQENNDSVVVTSKILYEFDRKTIWYAGGAFSEKTSRTSSRGIGEIDTGKYDNSEEVTFASGCCMLLPIKVISQIGYMSEDYFLYSEDADLCCKIRAHGYRLIYQPNSVIYHKVSASTQKLNELMTCYIVRNKLILIKKHIKQKYKLLAYSYITLESLKRAMCGEYTFLSVVNAYKYFCHGQYGKLDMN